MLRGNGIDVVGDMNVVVCRCRNDVGVEGRTELLGLSDFSIDLGNGEFRRRPIPLSLALHAGIGAPLLTVNVDPILPLACSAVAHKLGVAPEFGRRDRHKFLRICPNWLVEEAVRHWRPTCAPRLGRSGCCLGSEG